ncbi:hypothetical protein J5X98_14205 [Leptothermofonsia sichuanensis E412]|uniref:hypothetical protein n=1 Tax=Leptothermofonsia sichuanensis TaxID=2917832 RepID=UPI001CA77D47|nr:hypothetical protein [Leptothermofonsia sichuanensis]QZZ18637.1 hypothetical protein J5X98_14205 [Leptothermofonsia sichuanensis E412]
MGSVPGKSNSAIRHLTDQIVASGQITRMQHLQLTSALLAERKLTDEDRSQINRIFDYVQAGRLKLIDL